MMKRIIALLLTVSLLLTGTLSHAQAPAAEKQPLGMAGLTKEEINARFTGSFFLSPVEVAVIQRAILGRKSGPEKLGLDKKAPEAIPVRRVIRLSGVVWRAPGDWIVWMNGQKVTPKNLLPEIIDIKVENSSQVSLKWYDVGLNAVISITLRPHQTYDITTGILLPG